MLKSPDVVERLPSAQRAHSDRLVSGAAPRYPAFPHSVV
jgi:hypothetical protein